ncbi:uncharacterized protein LOC118763984 [Octopus sinensis]|uniref:Uncharacterized protein LOC118763984 n=1 Tax=Octopus sinensis TaxID=2607531 RepID=A0A7E6EX90_9MOLL|nr:uncharacterized protein LOC118763984 [Octopus sinensis]
MLASSRKQKSFKNSGSQPAVRKSSAWDLLRSSPNHRTTQPCSSDRRPACHAPASATTTLMYTRNWTFSISVDFNNMYTPTPDQFNSRYCVNLSPRINSCSISERISISRDSARR